MTLTSIYKKWPTTKEEKLQWLVQARKAKEEAEEIEEQLKAELLPMMDQGEHREVEGKVVRLQTTKRMQDTLLAREWCKAHGYHRAIKEKLDTKEARKIMVMEPDFEELITWANSEYIVIG